MGQQASVPRKGAKLRVIGAGMPRTGTASFSRALEILLDGPVYHGGTQVTLGPERGVKTWIELFSHWPAQDEATEKMNLELIRSQTDGFVAMTDNPCLVLVPELMKLYPEALVICTQRDIDSWEKSMAVVSNAATMSFLHLVLFLVPTMRYFVQFIDSMRPVWLFRYGETEPPTRKSYNRHVEWLKEIVPPERLVFMDVKDGWEPLCKALDLPVPKDVPFPNINDSKAIDELAKRQVRRGLARWAVLLAVGGMSVAVAVRKGI
ncbi:P-loop containing nucleoside triphosphate hydrolase protein [Trichoderma velutinum]